MIVACKYIHGQYNFNQTPLICPLALNKAMDSSALGHRARYRPTAVPSKCATMSNVCFDENMRYALTCAS